jgi:carnosine N-methyltransferase
VPPAGRAANAGLDLQEVYRKPEFRGAFDAVTTCFFLDTAHNFIDYIETIHK